MPLDFDSLRKKLSTLQGQNNRSTALWKPTEGKTIIRIVPWKERPDNPFIELYFHYLGRKTQMSPLTNGNPDPIAEFADRLADTGDKEDWQHSRQFRPKLRTFVPVIVRGEEDKGVRMWGFGKTVYEALLNVISDPDYGDITDVESGRDIGIEFTPQNKSDTNFAQTSILVKPKETALSDDAEVLEGWLTEQPDVTEIWDEPTYDDLKSFLDRFLNPEADVSTTATEKAPAKEAADPAEIFDAPADTTETAEVAETVVEESTLESVDSEDVEGEFERLFATN